MLLGLWSGSEAGLRVETWRDRAEHDRHQVNAAGVNQGRAEE